MFRKGDYMDYFDYSTNDLYVEDETEIYSEELSSSAINFHNITHDDMLNGDGLRVVLWVSGCEHHCKDCQNLCTWNPDDGIPLTAWEESEFWNWLDKPWTQGATFSGGDPLHPANRSYIASMMKRVKERYGDKKDIWCYTGYVLQHNEAEGFYLENSITGESFDFPGLQYIDVLVDGRFDCNVRNADIISKRKVLWRGSSNQRLVDIQASLRENRIILRKES